MAYEATPPIELPFATTIVCPSCGGPVVRVEKRFIDRLLGPLVTRKGRYRCTIVTCGWTTSERMESEPALLRAWNTGARVDSATEDSGPRRPGFRR